MIGREQHPPARLGRFAPHARAHNATAPRERQEPHAGGILAFGRAGIPARFAKGQQYRRIGDTGAVVDDGDDPVALELGRDALDGDVDAPGAGAAGVLEQLGEDIAEARIEELRHAAERALVNSRPDGRRGRFGGTVHREHLLQVSESKRPRRWIAGGAEGP